MKKFTENLEEFYNLIAKKQKDIGDLYKIIDGDYEDERVKRYIYEFLDECGLTHNKENILALVTRLVSLRDEQLISALKKEKKSEEEIKRVKNLSYLWSKNFYLDRFKEFLKETNERQLLNEFYRTLLEGIHEVGIIISDWQYDWNEYIIENINENLKSEFGNDVYNYLRENGLFERDENGEFSDRSYSVLVKKEDGYKIVAYGEFFSEYTDKIVQKFDELIEKLSKLSDKDTNQKEPYILYLKSLREAFGERRVENLLKRWQDVDRAWMGVTSPLQIGHPLEYYEDHYRKCVALEWDLRVSNPKNLQSNDTLEAILSMHKRVFEEIGLVEKVYKRVEDNLKRVQLYIGRPALYYGAEFNGLFSAQVVPNDETVTKEFGKKIFAFADNILDAQRAKPPMKINRVVFGDDFVKKEREFIFGDEKIWHKVYEITTIGHEYGHILWLDEDSENIMNKSGVFKNIEEFKATTGGLTAHFLSGDESLWEEVLRDLVKRSVSLIAWMKTSEVEPYYCEGLIHLKALFDIGVLEFNGDSLDLDISKEAYLRVKEWYIKVYKDLALHYIQKRDAKEFLENFASKEESVYMPKDREVYSFVKYYWSLYQDIGREVDSQL